MTVSPNKRSVRWLLLLALIALAGAAACRGPAGLPAGSMLDRRPDSSLRLPDALDHQVRDLAVEALVGERDDAQQRVAVLERAIKDSGNERSGLAPLAQHLVDAMHDDPIAYRSATQELVKRGDLEEAMRRKLEIGLEGDPLAIANLRISESRRRKTARAFNALSSAIGRSVVNFTAAPVRIGGALLNLGLAHRMDEAITLQERQALHHWRRYVETHPGAPEAPQLVARIESAQERWFEMKRKRSLRAAEKALDLEQDEVAFLLADRALRYAVEDEDALRMRTKAQERLAKKEAGEAASLRASEHLDPVQTGEDARRLAEALFNPAVDLAATAREIALRTPELATEARLAEISTWAEAGREEAMWDAFDEIAQRDQNAIERQAKIRLDDPSANPYRAFRKARAKDRGERASFVLFGAMKDGPRDLDLPRPIEWLIDGPSFVGTLGGIPQRLAQDVMKPPVATRPAVHARNYLRRYPEGEYADEMREWLIDFEKKRDNWVAAYALLQRSKDVDENELTKFREKAAEQALESVDRHERRDVALAVLREVATRYPDTEAARRANRKASEVLRDAATQQIRISRGFLEENPHIAGPQGLGLRPTLLDNAHHNGELHPNGVMLLGGRELEIALLSASGDEEDPPETRREKLPATQLSRLVSLLDETAQKNALTDPLAGFEPDADRDLFFERARLGVAEQKDLRATATSSYAFIGVREKYTMVRTHEPLLPFDIVVQGSFPDLGFGAFPKLRPPEESPDAVLYR